MELLATNQNSAWSMQVDLTGVSYFIDLAWNAMNQYWVMGISDLNNVPIVTGLKVVTNYDITSGIVATGMPQGEILCQSIINSWENLQRYDLGVNAALVYYEPDEILR
jgi:hypothetical protein